MRTRPNAAELPWIESSGHHGGTIARARSGRVSDGMPAPEEATTGAVMHDQDMSLRARDRLVVVVAALLQSLNAQPGSFPAPSDAASAIGLFAAIVGGAALLARRQAPLLVLAAAASAYVVQAGLTGPCLPVVVLVAAYSAARHGPLVWGPLWGAASTLAVTAALALIDELGVAPLYDAAIFAAVLAGALGAARSTRRGALLRQAAADERLRIARDLHDIVGHGVGAITVQAGAGRMALEADAQDEVRSALSSIEQAGRDVLRETRWLVGLLRDQPESPKIADLQTLAGAADRAGLTVDLQIGAGYQDVETATQEAAYRIVQEALTNVVRHSGATCCTVRLDASDDLVVEVRDEGTAVPGGVEGHGIRGMRERADTVGGDLSAGPAQPGPGWTVVARLPLGRSRKR